MNGNTTCGEITFQSICNLIRRSFVRIVIFCLIAAVLCGGVTSLILLLPRNNPVYQAIVEFNYEGAEDGLDPWGRTLNVTKIKSDSIITKALEDNNFDQEARALLKNKLKDNINIAGVVPDDIMEKILVIKEIATKNPAQLNDINELSYTSTSFVVSLEVEKDLDLTDNQSIAVLNSIVDNYIAQFKKDYGYGEALGSIIAGGVDFEDYDYIEIYDLFNSQINDILRFVDLRIAEASSFRSTVSKMTFEDMKARVVAVKNSTMKPLELLIFQNGLTKEGSAIAASKFIVDKIESLTREISSTQAALTATQDAIDNFTFAYDTKTFADGSFEKTVVNTEPLVRFQTDLQTYQKLLVNQTAEKGIWTERLAYYDPAAPAENKDPQATAKSDALINEINASLMKEIGYINEAVQEFIDSELLKNSVQKSVAAVKIPYEGFDIKVLMIVVLLGMFAAFMIALAVTNSKDKKARLAAPELKKIGTEAEKN